MTIIYAAEYSDYEDSGIIGLFSNLSDAKKALEVREREDSILGVGSKSYYVTEYELDELNKYIELDERVYSIDVDFLTGENISFFKGPLSIGPEKNYQIWGGRVPNEYGCDKEYNENPVLRFSILAKSNDDARNKTEKIRLQLREKHPWPFKVVNGGMEEKGELE